MRACLDEPAAGGNGYTVLAREMDVRPGGREHVKGRWETGVVSTFDAVYHDVVADERIVYAYEMRLDDRKISVSLATLELKPAGTGTRLVMTEQGAFLDGGRCRFPRARLQLPARCAGKFAQIVRASSPF